LVASACALGASLVGAQPWPSRPVQIWHGFAAGSNPDIIARIIQPGLSERLGQPVIIDMKPGASGRIATAFVAKQPPDGHTLIMLTGADGVMAATVTDLPYDLLRDFAFVSTTTVFPFLFLVPSDSPYQTLGQLIEDARKRPGKLSYGHSGVASALHLAGELLKNQAGIDLVHVPYKGGPLQELAAGRLDMAVGVSSSAMPLIKAGRLRVLAVTSLKRDPSFPDVPAVDETVPGYEITSWLGLAAPAGTSQTTVDRLSTEVRAVLAREDVAARMRAMGVEPIGMTSGEFRARVEADIHKWRRLAARISLQ
jgi:tripartite-type tricarboxylate transporter receptor subunit TctC